MKARGWAQLYGWQVDRAASTPLFHQIYLQIRSAILSRAFPPGTKLPSTRELAGRLSVARASVVSAYEQLLAEGYLSGKVGSGTYISSDLPKAIPLSERKPTRSAARPGRLPARVRSFSIPDPALQDSDLPFNTGRVLFDARTLEVWRKLTNRALRSFGANHLGYSDPAGFLELRTAICEYLQAARAVRCDPEQVVVTSGAQQVL